MLFGSVNYTHLNECEGSSATNDYPEVIAIHTASSDSNIYLGFTLANYPEDRKPAVSHCILESI
ncbi:hypothetical protein J8L98_06155 [Pseudoalteromonas sp. MMG013]|uniref:hypothetical protein n=1 Tax=Pseudoalteromonas sp. MMG013 TaxID=2822687 RepID=UPI001B389113|nr:hypothetical protein [Pseudoalteromonas sp. MMG013]MBQ4861271.1 hypothetical protein [Pseudoalteromonas sp. MMG013]